MPSLLAIDDDRLVLDCLKFAFPQDQVTLHTAGSAAQGLDLLAQKKPDAVLMDIGLPDMSGLDAFKRLRQIDPKVPVIFMTGDTGSDLAIEAMRLGAYDHLLKPFDPDHLVELVERAFAISRLMRVPVQTETDQSPAQGDRLIGRCSAMQAVYKAIGRVAPQDVTVLILGESGTGKEMVARAIYHYSKRSGGPFLAINCAAIPETLLEAELFGHEKGAFTGAERRRIGKFEQCNGGTLFLDEIGDMSPVTQTKILRVLQDQQFERVGGNETIKTDVRVITATNRDLEKMMALGQFRGDLYYRLNVFTIRVPPLRERKEDLRLLVDYFLKRFAPELGKQVQTIDPAALAILSAYSWPGNIRELQSVLKQALLEATGPVLWPDFLPAALTGARPADASVAPASGALSDVLELIQQRLKEDPTELYNDVIHQVERVLLAEVLRHTGGNQSQASRLLGITRQTLRNRLAALGMAGKGGEEGD